MNYNRENGENFTDDDINLMENKKKLENILKYAETLKTQSLHELRNSHVNVPNNEFMAKDGYNQLPHHQSTYNINYYNDLKVIEDAIASLSEVLNDDDDTRNQKLDELHNKFNMHKESLNKLILRTFKHRSEEVLEFLGQLFHIYFGNNNDYLNLSEKTYASDLIKTLFMSGFIEFHPNDQTKIRLKSL